MTQSPLVEQLQSLLPQTQCERCGFKGCKPYAEALATGETDVNLCHPGGDVTMRALAALLGKPEIPLSEEAKTAQIPQVAFIREDECIGCTKCVRVCPVDAIIGSGKTLHAIIAKDCTGCGLCLPVCPVDCIDLLPTEETTATTWTVDASVERIKKANTSRSYFERRQARLAAEQLAKKRQHTTIIKETNYQIDIQEAIQRANAKRKKLCFETFYE